jgi:CDP-paratose 2-epimerase
MLKHLGVRLLRADIADHSTVMSLPAADWLIDCAANPSVQAGIGADEGGSWRVVQDNLVGTLNLLEYCKKHHAGCVILSTSRVYSTEALSSLPLKEEATRFVLDEARLPAGVTSRGVNESFSTLPPLSLYGATKACSETMAIEYAGAYGIPLWINRCGVIAGPGQFGKIDQGIISFWIYSWMLGRPLSYIGYGAKGKQVRDCVHVDDVVSLVMKQVQKTNTSAPRIVNVGGGLGNTISLLELSSLCENILDRRNAVGSTAENRPYDVPYYCTDNRLVESFWGWKPAHTINDIVESICAWAVQNKETVKGFM